MSVKADAESYDGNTANPYWNLWKSGAYTSSMTQQIDGLPEGTYTFSALVRGQNSATMTLSATVGEASVSESVQGGGADAIAGSGYPNGWQRITTPAFTVAHGQSLTIAFNMTASGTAWWSADHFALTLTEIPDSRTGIQDMPTEVLANGKSVNGRCYDLSGRHLDATKPLRRGLYIINGKKVIVK